MLLHSLYALENVDSCEWLRDIIQIRPCVRICFMCLCFSGGLPVTVIGSNLNAVQNPLLTVSVHGQRHQFHDVRDLALVNLFNNSSSHSSICFSHSLVLCFSPWDFYT